ncbi:hypothetical protein [Halapricum salinum]|uniref:Uncharacterized protein n=1 Tax=Halapricum salinum TaxID=1457250 RepID=A0A4D6HG41_9EURY|nr:hypothetical protein [Halapricum salinum]QCC52505.1 hypothetical protein DV733_15255 [Halapricum salinum]
MAPVEGRRWALVVFGPVVALIVLALVSYGALFAVPGGPCHGGGDLTAPQSQIEIAATDSSVLAVHVGGDALDSETTDRVVLVVRDADSPTAASTRWPVENGTVRLSETEAGFAFDERDTVRVRWYGKDPDVAGFCPNGRTIETLAARSVGNASVPIGT